MCRSGNPNRYSPRHKSAVLRDSFEPLSLTLKGTDSQSVLTASTLCAGYPRFFSLMTNSNLTEFLSVVSLREIA